MGKKPLLKKQVQTLRNNVRGKPLQELLLNLGVDLFLRSSDLLSLKVKDVISESGKVKTEVKVKQKKTEKTTLSITHYFLFYIRIPFSYRIPQVIFGRIQRNSKL